MRVAVDTSVAVPLIATGHPAHAIVNEWAAGLSLCLPAHALVETYSVLTRLPGDARVSPADATEAIDANFGEVVHLSAARQSGVHRDLSDRAIVGGAVYDALICLAAADAGLPLATRDARARATFEALGVQVEVVA
jgi:predicted nucleic acid-binding protein